MENLKRQHISFFCPTIKSKVQITLTYGLVPDVGYFMQRPIRCGAQYKCPSMKMENGDIRHDWNSCSFKSEEERYAFL